MAFALTGTKKVSATSNGFKFDPFVGCTVGWWMRRLRTTATDDYILDWFGSNRPFFYLSGNIMRCWLGINWGMAPSDQRAYIAGMYDLEDWHYYAVSISNDNGLFCVTPFATNGTPYPKSGLTSKVLTSTDAMRVGWNHVHGASEIEIAEVSKFDWAISQDQYDELAKGFDPLKLGSGPAWHLSCGPNRQRNRGDLAIPMFSAVQTPQPTFLRR